MAEECKETTPDEPSISVELEDYKTRLLAFLSTANNETICACLVSLAAVTYVVLGRVGLILIGALGGIVLHATWVDSVENGTNNGSDQSVVERKKRGLGILERALDWQHNYYQERTSSSESKDDDFNTDVVVLDGKELGFADFQTATRAALTSLVDSIVRDYVK